MGRANFMVLKSPDVPSILIETAFISNPGDESNLANRHYRQQLAQAIYNGVTDYFVANPPPGSQMALEGRSLEKRPVRTVQHVIRRGDTLSGIADQYDVPVGILRTTNQLRSDKIVVGRVLRIPTTT